MTDVYNTGFGTTPGMWEFLSELLDGEQLPKPLSDAITLLQNGQIQLCNIANNLPTLEEDHF